MNRRELLKASLVLPLAGLLKDETPENKTWLIRSRNPVIDNSPYIGRQSVLNFKSSEAFISPCDTVHLGPGGSNEAIMENVSDKEMIWLFGRSFTT